MTDYESMTIRSPLPKSYTANDISKTVQDNGT